MQHIHTSYLREVLCPRTLPRTLRALRKLIDASGIEFNAIAFRGMSGALVAPILALRMKKGLLVCRKPSEESHAGSDYKVEGLMAGGNYIIIDDSMDTGTTLRDIMNRVEEQCTNFNDETIWDDGKNQLRKRHEHEKIPPFVCVAIFFYRREGNNTFAHGGREIPIFGCRVK